MMNPVEVVLYEFKKTIEKFPAITRYTSCSTCIPMSSKPRKYRQFNCDLLVP